MRPLVGQLQSGAGCAGICGSGLDAGRDAV